LRKPGADLVFTEAIELAQELLYPLVHLPAAFCARAALSA
jgi:hypothetical protein